MNNFVPIWKYAKEKGISRQTIYRWIREGKVSPDKFRKTEVVIKRIEISNDFELMGKK